MKKKTKKKKYQRRSTSHIVKSPPRKPGSLKTRPLGIGSVQIQINNSGDLILGIELKIPFLNEKRFCEFFGRYIEWRTYTLEREHRRIVMRKIKAARKT